MSHLFHADDKFIFCEAGSEQLGCQGSVLLCFEAVLWLRVTLAKLEICKLESYLPSILGCRVGSLSVSCLGALGSSFKAKVVWEGVVERF